MSGSDLHDPPEDLMAMLERAMQRAEEFTGEAERLRKRLTGSEHADLAGKAFDEQAIREEEKGALQAEMRQIQQENEDLANRLVLAEKENTQLVNLYVAGSQLHSSLEIAEVRNSIVEIIINLVGAEKFVVYMFNEQARTFVPVAAEGAELSEFPTLPVDDEAFSGALTSSEHRFAAADSEDGTRPVAWIPLQMRDGRPIGAIAIYSLLLQKDGFSPLDHQLFALLAESAASALVAAKLYSDSERKAQTFRGFFDLLTK